jgi:THAP domain/Transposase protein
MPAKCCVPGCRGNYDPTEKVSVFRFPSEKLNRDLRAKWIRQIPRDEKDYNVTSNTVVCEKHFVEEFIVRYDEVTRLDGSILRMKRDCPKLTKDAYPTLFPKAPAYLSSKPPTKRRAPEERRLELSARDEDDFSAWLHADKIADFCDLNCKLNDCLKDFLLKNWIIIKRDQFTCIASVSVDDIPRFNICIRIDKDLLVKVYKDQNVVNSATLSWVLGQDCRLSCWSQLSSLVSHFDCFSAGDSFSVTDQVALVDQCLKELTDVLTDSDECEPDVLTRLKFLHEQILLLFMKQKRYSAETTLAGFRFFALSGSVYRRLRDSLLTLPHISYMKRLSSVFSLSDGVADSTHAEYLKHKAKLLQPHEKHVILLLDEIYVEPKQTFKGGYVSGFAANSPLDQASTVQTFMLSSLLSPNKDVAAMVPVKNLTAAYLRELTTQVVTLLENCGYFVLALISDNNRVNRNMFTALCGGSLKPFVQHPCAEDRKLFFLFDSVHLLKCIRNNWLGQADPENTFVYPEMFDANCKKEASLSSLRNLYVSVVNLN